MRGVRGSKSAIVHTLVCALLFVVASVMGALHILLCIWANRQPCRSSRTNTGVAGQGVVHIMDHW